MDDLGALAKKLHSAGLAPRDVLEILRSKNDQSAEPVPNETLDLIIRNVFRETEQYEQVPLDEYLSRVEAFLRRYVAFPSDYEPVAIALWIAHTHFVDVFDVSPILAVG